MSEGVTDVAGAVGLRDTYRVAVELSERHDCWLNRG